MKPVFLSLLCFFAVSISVGEDRNILLLISDNHTWTDVGCYGHPSIKTPDLDKLASEGIRFEHAFATTASCGPSRAVMYTGLLTHANGQYAHPTASTISSCEPMFSPFSRCSRTQAIEPA